LIVDGKLAVQGWGSQDVNRVVGGLVFEQVFE
jgi:hypothetical protein